MLSPTFSQEWDRYKTHREAAVGDSKEQLEKVQRVFYAGGLAALGSALSRIQNGSDPLEAIRGVLDEASNAILEANA